MAMGLSPGRGGGRRTAGLAGLHLLGAALAGALVGGVLGGVGWLLGLAAWRPWLVGAAALWALGLGLRRRPLRLGRQRQVPQAWNRTMPPGRRYLLWGALLGSALATPVYHSAALVLLAAQLGAGVGPAAAAGAAFGAARQALALLPGLRGLGPPETMALLPRLRPAARRLNALVVVGGALALVLAGWR